MIRRRKYLIKRGLQFRYIGAILVTVFIVALICVTTTYYSLLVLFGEKLANVYPQGRLMVTLKQVNLIVLSRILILLPFVAVAGLLLSHRIAGPVFRIEKVLKEIGDGNFDIQVHLRKRDELKDVAAAINQMNLNLKERKLKEEGILHKISDTSKRIKELLKEDPLNKPAIAEELNSIIKETS